MVGSKTVIEKIESKNVQMNYTESIKAVLGFAEIEEKTIKCGQSDWSMDLLQDVVIPEMSTLLSYAENNLVYYKYGKEQRLLESTYYISDTLKPIHLTELGKAILKVQRIINNF